MLQRSLKRVFALLITAGLIALALPVASKPARSSKIRRTILLRFKPEASPTEVQKILREVKANLAQLKGVRNIFVGAQVRSQVAFQYGISMDFDDEAALKAYRQDEEHRRTHNDYSHLVAEAQISDIRDE
jgi:hypothetical protein